MTELTEILRQQEPITPDQADRITASWPGLLTSPIKTVEQREEVVAALEAIGEPARSSWIMARVAALLSQYYAADVPPSVVAMMAEDWLEELQDYPQWAITKAVRWWKSSDNPNRKRRPVEGDISARAHHELALYRLAQISVSRFDRDGAPKTFQEPIRPVMTPEEAEASRKRVADIVSEFARRANISQKETN